MTGIRLHAIDMLNVLWVLPLLAAVHLYAAHRRRQAARRFAEEGLLDRISLYTSPKRRVWRAAIVLAATAFIAVALARPAWNPHPKTVTRHGRDVVFLLDVSKSMLAEDLAPNRLERAKLAISDCLERLEGDRVGLVVFAGTAAVRCPLTLDYGFFRMMLDGVSTDSVSRGGTLIGDALRKTLDEVFDDQERQHKDVILITDGEDHESFPAEAAAEVGDHGIRLLAIGLGGEDQGKRIPITDESGRKTFLTYQGQEVWTKLDADMLRKMVDATPGGKYLNVATGAFDLGKIYEDLVASAEKRDLEAQTITLYEEKFQIFLGIAVFLLAAELAAGDWARRRT